MVGIYGYMVSYSKGTRGDIHHYHAVIVTDSDDRVQIPLLPLGTKFRVQEQTAACVQNFQPGLGVQVMILQSPLGLSTALST